MEPHTHQESLSSSELLEQSSLYKNFAEQREEILKHKWVLSEKLGKDIGFENALLDWTLNHRKDWLKQKRKTNSSENHCP